MTRLVVDKNINSKLKNKLLKMGYELIYTTENKKLLDGINCHPDMLLRPLENRDIICDKENIDYYKKYFEGYNLIETEKILDKKYPLDVALNFVTYNGYFIHNLSYTDKKVINYYKDRNYKFINVRQGYTKCNILIGKNSLITSDDNIYNKLKEIFNILLIEHGQIVLRGFNYGFIGGASGFLDNKIMFTGDFKNHSSYKKMIEFLERNNEEYVILTDEPIEDYGSILEIR
ncbi:MULTISPECIES: DUF6873 family GME fold protein [Peptoniphilus]|uniref:DUF6873 family GME fold protein n=1 Tax=Peptoniphilus TaxID=162289 RepID=UPI0001DA9C6E|nr:MULTISPECIES: hypothetical protein [Peptoniphilus]EFI42224.1 hypothetical protein HMPREF0629_00868 [Peptoniphilus sp. oral taxon 386 str. F0131]